MTYILKKLLTSYQHQKPIHKLKHPVENGVSMKINIVSQNINSKRRGGCITKLTLHRWQSKIKISTPSYYKYKKLILQFQIY